MAKPTWSWAGEPVNLEAAAADADKWLELLARNASVLRMPPADYINLIDCRAALAKFIGEQDAKFKLTMRIRYERAGRCFWHLNCTAQRHAPPMKIERDDAKAKQTLLRCTACNSAGWYPHGSVGEVCCAEEAAAGVPESDSIGRDGGPSVEALMPRVWALAVAHAEYAQAPNHEKERVRKEAVAAVKAYARRLAAGVSAPLPAAAPKSGETPDQRPADGDRNA